MDAQFEKVISIVIAVSMFGLIVSLWTMGLWAWQLRRSGRQQRLRQRLAAGGDEKNQGRLLRLWHDGREETTLVPGGRKVTLWIWLNSLRHSAGFRALTHTILFLLIGAAGLTAMTLYTLTGSVPASIIAMAAVLLVFWAYLRQRIAQRTMIFDRQFVDAMELAARSLRAGHPLNGAFRLIGNEIPDPVGSVFAEICDEEKFGIGHEEAMLRVAARHGHPDMRLFATAVSIQIRSGGNLADMMDRLSAVVRERMRLGRRVRVLTAQTNFSKNILLALPFVVFFALAMLNPNYLRTLYETQTGQRMMMLAGAGLLFGAWVMNRLSDVRA